MYPYKNYIYPLNPSNCRIIQGEDIRQRDIHDITISNIKSSTSLYSQAVALLARAGQKIYNIHIRGVYDTNSGGLSDRLAVVGSYKGYFAETYTSGDLSRLRISDVVSHSAKAAVVFNDIVSDVRISGVRQYRRDGVVVKAVCEDGITVTNSRVIE